MLPPYGGERTARSHPSSFPPPQPHHTGSTPQTGEAPNGQTLAEILRSLDELRREVRNLRQAVEGARKDFYTVEEVARLTGRSAYTVRKWVKERRIDATRVEGTGPKGRLLVPRSELDKLIGDGLGGQVAEAVAAAN
jgi:excisionase family DNA binding protein